jgi:hypothetical protein
MHTKPDRASIAMAMIPEGNNSFRLQPIRLNEQVRDKLHHGVAA